ncbi:MAG: hypothetical protein OK455_03340 [Thaumarchaeota archaeon]|nr:hypothetical protein [Nitrososphaerota archaeon]
MAQHDTAPEEIMLAQEQAVINRGSGVRQEAETAFGFGKESEGTLVLTDRRLVYVHGKEEETDVRIGAFSKKRLIFSDVESLHSMQLDSASFEIPISNVQSVEGHHREAMAPKLGVKWNDEAGEAKATEFVQQITGGSRRKNLNDWAEVIERLKAKQQRIQVLPASPGSETLEGKIIGALGDMQEKGAFTIEREVEDDYGVRLEPDEVEEACERLVRRGLVSKTGSPGDGEFYRKVSPLGEDDLSA